MLTAMCNMLRRKRIKTVAEEIKKIYRRPLTIHLAQVCQESVNALFIAQVFDQRRELERCFPLSSVLFLGRAGVFQQNIIPCQPTVLQRRGDVISSDLPPHAVITQLPKRASS